MISQRAISIKKNFSIVLIFQLLLIGGLTNTTPLNLVLTVPQITIILFFLVTNKLESAVFYHFLFLICSYTYYGSFEGISENLTIVSYNYAKLKIWGPIGYSQILSLALLIFIGLKYKTKSDRNCLFQKFYRLLIMFMITGFGIGLLGIALSDYFIEGMINYGSYILILFINASILLMMRGTTLRYRFLRTITPLLVLSPITTFIIHKIYPNMYDYTGISVYVMLLLPAMLFERKNNIYRLIGLIFWLYNAVYIYSSGKMILSFLIFLIVTFTLTMRKEIKKRFYIRAHFIRMAVIVLLLTLPIMITIVTGFIEKNEISSNIIYKIVQVKTLLKYLIGGSNIESVSSSPYIRITSLINILYEGLKNPLTLLFGKGYGGYFTDNFNFFSGLNLYNGAFSNKSIILGKFYTGHDTLVTVPMLNGILGLYLILKLVVRCLNYSRNNYIILSAIQFLLLIFYFDTLIGITGVLLLFVGSIELYDDTIE